MHVKSEQVITLLTPDDKARLAILANRRQLTLSEMVREILRDRLDAEPGLQLPAPDPTLVVS